MAGIYQEVNTNFACGNNRVALANYYSDVVGYLHTHANNLAVMISLYFNVNAGQSPANWTSLWTYVLVQRGDGLIRQSVLNFGFSNSLTTMSHFHPVDLSHASRLINHGPTVLITTSHGNRRNVMAAAWSMPVEFTPPRIAVVIDKSTFTRELAAASGTFGLIVPGAGMIDLAYAVGTTSGRDIDKFEHFGIDTIAGPVLGLPLIETNCAAWMECRLISEPHTEDAYDTCFAEVVSAAADPRIFSNGHWTVDDSNTPLHTIHHLGAGKFVRASAMQIAQPIAR